MIPPAIRRQRLRALCAVARGVLAELDRAGGRDDRLDRAVGEVARYCEDPDHGPTLETLDAARRDAMVVRNAAADGTAMHHAADLAYDLCAMADNIEMDNPGLASRWVLETAAHALVALGESPDAAAARVQAVFMAAGPPLD